jgi:hypothetical protein
LLQALGDRRLAAAHRAQQIEDLLLLFKALRSVAEIRDHLLDHLLHSVELTECRIHLDDLVREDPRQARVVAGIDLFRFPDCFQHAFTSRRVRGWIVLAEREILLQRELFLSRFFEAVREAAVNIHATSLA